MAHLKCLTVILKRDLSHLIQERESVPVDKPLTLSQKEI